MEITLRAIWNAFNSAHSFVVHGVQLNFWFWLVAFHFVLAIATLGLGDRTICDIARPLRKIFKPDVESVLDGVLEVVVAVPRAFLYYVSLYIRSYILTLRVFFLAYISIVPALLTPIVLSLVGLLLFGNVQVTPENEIYFRIGALSVVPSWAYWYWRIDAKRLITNLWRSFKC
jgi:hypothetical protein